MKTTKAALALLFVLLTMPFAAQATSCSSAVSQEAQAVYDTCRGNGGNVVVCQGKKQAARVTLTAACNAKAAWCKANPSCVCIDWRGYCIN